MNMKDTKTQTMEKNLKTVTSARPIASRMFVDGAQLGFKTSMPLSQVIPMVDGSVVQYQRANRDIVKRCAKKYIRAHIMERNLFKFMMGSIKYEHMDFLMSDNVAYDLSEYEESEYITDVFSANIRKNQRWFNDLMLYLSGKYTDGQLLNADFFRVINNKRARAMFIENMRNIDTLTNYRAKCSQKLYRETRAQIAQKNIESQKTKQK